MIVAFDIGIKNFAFAVKSKGEFILLKNTNLDEDSMTKTSLNLYKKEELIELMEDLKISTNEKMKKKDMVDLIFKKNKPKVKKDLSFALFKIMDDHKATWEKCETFLIERQWVTNMQALKLSHYLEAYLKIYYPTKTILNYNAAIKTKKLGAINLKTKKDRKEWTIKYVSELLEGENLRFFKTLKKKDDVADVICMIEAFEAP